MARSGLPDPTFARVTLPPPPGGAPCLEWIQSGPARRLPVGAASAARPAPPTACFAPPLSWSPVLRCRFNPRGHWKCGDRSAADRLRPRSPRPCNRDPAGGTCEPRAPLPGDRGGLTGHAQERGGRAPREPSACTRGARGRPSRGAACRRPLWPTPWPAWAGREPGWPPSRHTVTAGGRRLSGRLERAGPGSRPSTPGNFGVRLPGGSGRKGGGVQRTGAWDWGAGWRGFAGLELPETWEGGISRRS